MSMRDMLFDIYDLGVKDEEHYRKTYPTFYFRDHNRIREHIHLASVKPKVYTMARPHPDPEWHKIAVWWNTFVKTGIHAKKQNLWITSPPDTGKTTKILMPMLERAEGYELLDHDEYWNPFIGKYDFAFADEFRGRIQAPMLNAFCSPKPMTLHAMGTMTQKTQNLPVVICSNYTPEDLYFRDDEILKAVQARFTICAIKPSEINVF